MSVDRLSATFAAWPIRPVRHSGALVSGRCSVTELAEPFNMSMPAVSKHLRVLERAGLIARRREAQWRRCRIDGAPLKEVANWTERYRHIWEARLDRLDTYLKHVKAKAEKSHGRSQLGK